MPPLDPSQWAYAFAIATLLSIVRLAWQAYHQETGTTPELVLACVCAAMVLFLTAVPGAAFLVLRA